MVINDDGNFSCAACYVQNTRQCDIYQSTRLFHFVKQAIVVSVFDDAKKITDGHEQHENISIVECERMSSIVLIVVVLVHIEIFTFNITSKPINSNISLHFMNSASIFIIVPVKTKNAFYKNYNIARKSNHCST